LIHGLFGGIPNLPSDVSSQDILTSMIYCALSPHSNLRELFLVAVRREILENIINITVAVLIKG
jgi:hypothetical protein